MAHKPSEERIRAIQEYINECFHFEYYSTQINYELDMETERKASKARREEEKRASGENEEIVLLKKIKKFLGMDSVSKAPSRKLEDVVKEVEETFSQHLMRYIKEHGLKDVDVYKKANMDRKLFSKIKNDEKYRPSKTTALVLALALEMNSDETRDLLKRAGFALSHSSKQDIIVEYYINNGVYDLYEINEALLHFDEPLLWE